MRESTTYQAILEEGKAEGLAQGQLQEARRVLLRLASKRFGAPDTPTKAAVKAIGSVERLERLTLRVLDVGSWEELLR